MTLPVSPRPLRVLVADDQELVRAGFRLILEAAGFTVVGEAADGAEALTLAAREHPDVVLMDIRMPVMDGLAATRQLTAPARIGLTHGAPDTGRRRSSSSPPSTSTTTCTRHCARVRAASC